jgi:hypothetical protein
MLALTPQIDRVADRLDRYFVGKRPYDTWELDGPTLFHTPHSTQHLEVQRYHGRAVLIHYDSASVPQRSQPITVSVSGDSDQDPEIEQAPRKKVKQIENTRGHRGLHQEELVMQQQKVLPTLR